MDGARDQLLPGTGFPQDQHVRIGRSNRFNLPQNPLQSRAAANNLLEIMFDLGIFVLDFLQPVALPEVLHKGDPSKGRELQHRGRNQNRDPSPIFAKHSFSKGVQAPYRKPSSCASSSRCRVFREE